ncbi:hypothetical protein ACP70R_036336 [Stipagrostis hirtigluma subsp. patula]
MAPSKLREALGAAKDQTTIGLARAGGADEVAADLEVAIVRATAHGEGIPADERHVQEILTLTRYSKARVAACVASLSRRLGRTRAWHVAVKALALVHRLLADGDPAYEQEVFLAARGGRRMLDMSRFRGHDRVGSRVWHFSAFVRAYGSYLDGRLKHRMKGRGAGVASPRKWRLDGGRGIFHGTAVGTCEADEAAWAVVPTDKPAPETTTTEDLIAIAQQLKHLLDLLVACRPIGKARMNPVVRAALYMLVKESAAMYCELTEVMAVLIDRFAELETPNCVRVHSIFTGLVKLVDELDDFYSWCKATVVCRPSDVPNVERIKQKKLDLMDEFIRDRQASASWRSLSPPASFSSQLSHVDKLDVKATEQPLAPKEQQVVAQEQSDAAGNAAPAHSAGTLAVVDDMTADFLNLNDDKSPPSGEEHGLELALALSDDNPAETAPPEWVAFDDSSTVWETATQRAELGGGLSTTVLDGMYSHATANAALANAHVFAGSASSVAMRAPSATALALPPPPPGASGAATTEMVDPFAASLAVPPPTCVQMTDLQTRRGLLVQEQMAWQQYEMQKAAWSYNNSLL